MQVDDVRQLLASVARIYPAFSAWRRERLRELARVNGTTPLDEGRAMTDSWARTLAGVANEDALDVLEDLEAGRLEAPPYGELARWIRREASSRRGTVQRQERMELVFADAPRYGCPICRDRGFVAVVNPKFAAAYRSEFERQLAATEATPLSSLPTWLASQLRACGVDIEAESRRWLPSGWERRARLWWRQQGGMGPLVATAACQCSEPQAVIWREKTSLWHEPRRMPIYAANLQSSLEAWYRSENCNPVMDWQPRAEDYAARFA